MAPTRLVALTVGALTAATLAVAGRDLPSLAGPLPRQDDAPSAVAGMRLVDQTFTVDPGGFAHLELRVVGDVPEITTTTTTTSTTTTTTSTTTTTTSTTVAADADAPASAPSPTQSEPPPETATTRASTSTPSTQPTTTTTVPAPEMVVQVRAHDIVTTREAIAAADVGSTGPIVDLVEYDLDDVARFDEATGERFVELDIELAGPSYDDEPRFDRVDQLDLFDPGVYPITIQIRRDQRTIASHTTFIEVLVDDPTNSGPMRFSMFANIDDPGPTPTERQVANASEQMTRIVELAESTAAPLNLAIPPTVVRSIDTSDPALVERLRTALTETDTLLALPDFELDPSSAVAAGLADEFADRLVRGERQLGEEFRGVPVARAGWPVNGPISPSGATAVRDLGVPVLIVPESTYVTYPGNIGDQIDTTLLSSAATDDGSPIKMAIVDPIGAWFDPDVDTSFSPIERAVRAMAAANALRDSLAPSLRSMVVAPPRLRTPDAATTRAFELFVAQHPYNSFESLVGLPSFTNNLFIDQEPHTVELPDVVPVDLTARVDAADAMRTRIADVATMLPSDDSRPSDWEGELQLAMSTGLTDSEAEGLMSSVDAGIEGIRTSVGEPETFPITIAGREADIPVRIANRSSTPLTVVIRLSAEKLAVPGGDHEAELEPNEISETPIPVTARSNGVFPVTIELLTPAGNPLGEPVEFTARVNNLTGLGRVVTVGAALVLISWWFSYYRRKRRRQVGLSSARHPANGRSASDDDEHDDSEVGRAPTAGAPGGTHETSRDRPE